MEKFVLTLWRETA